MGRRLTVKETKLVKAKAQGKTHVQAAKEAGYSTNGGYDTIEANTRKVLARENVREALAVALERQGITLERALAPIDKGLSATKQNEYTGEITEDLKLQLQASDRALKLMGIGQENNTTNNFVQVIKEQTNKYV